jgi:lipopolysaccharide/colanic/teichoic acid biosynthesis glycosyltransferase
VKRAVDVVVAALLLVALLPLFAVIAVGVWVGGPGAIIYRGPRVGRDGRSFHILKFRTMAPAPATGRALIVKDDPRVTRLGRLLRTTKLDELPQLINVLRGEMSLVGPRPEAPMYVEFYTPEERSVLSVRPGITGLSQVLFRHEEQLLGGSDPEHDYLTVVMPAKLKIDLAYVRRRSGWLDLQILALTLVALVRPVSPPALPLPDEAGRDAARREVPVAAKGRRSD